MLFQRPHLHNGNIFDVLCSQQKIKWSKLHASSFDHGKMEKLTSFGTLKIDIFEVFGYGDFVKQTKSASLFSKVDQPSATAQLTATTLPLT